VSAHCSVCTSSRALCWYGPAVVISRPRPLVVWGCILWPLTFETTLCLIWITLTPWLPWLLYFCDYAIIGGTLPVRMRVPCWHHRLEGINKHELSVGGVGSAVWPSYQNSRASVAVSESKQCTDVHGTRRIHRIVRSEWARLTVYLFRAVRCGQAGEWRSVVATSTEGSWF